jgi:hypothetical protein
MCSNLASKLTVQKKFNNFLKKTSILKSWKKKVLKKNLLRKLIFVNSHFKFLLLTSFGLLVGKGTF